MVVARVLKACYAMITPSSQAPKVLASASMIALGSCQCSPPAIQARFALRLADSGAIDSLSLPATRQCIQADSQGRVPCQIRYAYGGCLPCCCHMHFDCQKICQRLHQIVIPRRTSTYPQDGKGTPCILLHGRDHLTHSARNAFQGSTNDVSTFRRTTQAENGSPYFRSPVRRCQSRQRRHKCHFKVIRLLCSHRTGGNIRQQVHAVG